MPSMLRNRVYWTIKLTGFVTGIHSVVSLGMNCPLTNNEVLPPSARVPCHLDVTSDSAALKVVDGAEECIAKYVWVLIIVSVAGVYTGPRCLKRGFTYHSACLQHSAEYYELFSRSSLNR